ncbi:GNAT family N-acetyltransferase [Ruegeria sp.]|uniref:GNAT family N-acetyltransferase n=1 Tax=Ruegeria sp. TaxID=1879320 RepID=UPI003B5C625F
MLNLSFGHQRWGAAIPEMFRDAFAASEGADEGEAIRGLVQDLISTTPKDDLLGYVAADGATVLGCIFFSRVTYENDPRQVFLMSPVAVKPDQQRTGIGQKLIGFGLENLRQKDVDYAVTYGDPAYYAKTGFQQITEAFARAPMPLSQPHGWLGQSLTDSDAPIVGPSRCVSAFDRPELW